jgi:hypothetical protein
MNLRWLLLTHAGATFFMVGLIWFVQVVHYPLFAEVARLGGEPGFASYAAKHSARTTLVVGPVMLVELVCAGVLLLWKPPHLPWWSVITGALLLSVIWVSTAFLQVPRHAELSAGFQTLVHQSLVGTNWLRTVLWTLRGGLALWMVSRGPSS